VDFFFPTESRRNASGKSFFAFTLETGGRVAGKPSRGSPCAKASRLKKRSPQRLRRFAAGGGVASRWKPAFFRRQSTVVRVFSVGGRSGCGG
jgi:hypothetical protein